MKEDYRGTQLAARFAIQPNILGHCGESPDQAILRNCIKGLDLPQARAILDSHNFPHLNAYIHAIAKTSHLPPFSEDVVRAYWIGSPLTEKTYQDGKDELVKFYTKDLKLFSKTVLDNLLPQHLFLTHLSQVAFIIANHYEQPERTEIINGCMIAKGEIIDINSPDSTAEVKREILVFENGKYRVGESYQTVKQDPDLTPVLTKGDLVAIHLSFVASILSPTDAQNLSFWTHKVTPLI